MAANVVNLLVASMAALYLTMVVGYTNDASDLTRQLIVLSPPKHNDPYYHIQHNVASNIVSFQISYAEQIMGRDNVVIVGDNDSLEPFREAGIPEDILLVVQNPMEDIWMRDFTTINPYSPFQLRYTADAQASDDKTEEEAQQDADYVQNHFINTFWLMGLTFPYYGSLVIDGGNIVDNYIDKIIVTSKFSTDNQIDNYETVAELQSLYVGDGGSTVNVAVIPRDPNDPLGHADGMVSFIDDDVIAISDMSYNQNLEQGTREALLNAFDGVTLVNMPDLGYEEGPDPHFASSCGISVNAVLTENYLYLPVFGEEGNPEVVELVQDNTSKTVVPVNADGVCAMGGSVRCLSWQQTGENARKIIETARETDASNPLDNPLPNVYRKK